MSDQQPKTNRSCGTCKLCCKYLAVEEIGKPCNKWCKYIDMSYGCSIYNNRPQSCRTFNCMWLEDGEKPEEDRVFTEGDRPDKLGVIFTGCKASSGEQVIQVWETKVGAVDSPYLRQMITGLSSVFPVIIRHQDSNYQTRVIKGHWVRGLDPSIMKEQGTSEMSEQSKATA